MKIKSLKINAFGNLKEKQIELDEHINIVQGENESGKSTLLKFITNIFYGTSKNKKGKEFSDYEKYKPWVGEEFSGKLTYCLDNNEQYEIYREFNKKNPTIYNKQLEDISKQYTIDKTNGNQFFVEQTGIDENVFLSTLVSMQQEVEIDKNTQNSLVQKVANLAGTGDDNISYKKAIDKLNKKQVEEIGTTRSQGRPINVVKEEKFKIQDEIGELETFKQRKIEIEEEKTKKQLEINQIQKTIEIIKKIKEQKEKENLEKEKIKITENLINTQKQRKEQLEKEKNTLIIQKEEMSEKQGKHNDKKSVKKSNIALIFMIIGIIIQLINIIKIKSNIVMIAFILEIVLTFVMFIIEKKKEQKQEKNKKEEQKKSQKTEEIEKQIERIETEEKILKNNIEEQESEIEKSKQKLNLEINLKKENIKENLENKEKVDELFLSSNIQYELEKIEEEKNNKNLYYQSLILEEKNIIPKLEKISLLEEQFEELKQREETLEKNNEAIELTKQILEVAYQKMKQNVTPKLTEQLSENIQKISNNKYTKIMLHEEEKMLIEKENGEYISLEKLSVGTIDQLYLSLRLAIIKELSDETMPIILDESFAYYDEERLKNILTYLSTEFRNNQIIIFTCTNREKEILKNLNIKYNYIHL